jgi:light-regulated signal transduction histidine kinase (bacteriophytochrome)
VSAEPVTLDNCAREPIHIPGSIQPHGVLLACSGDDAVVTQVSANVEAWCGRPVANAVGAPLASMLSEASASDLALALRQRVLREVSPLRVVLDNGSALDATLHRSGERLIVELERASPAASAFPRGFDPRLRASVLHLQQASDVRKLCEVAAKEVRLVTGFDRVMVYRFDAAWNGEVVAEERRADLEPFLGLHYPASDIPEQARRLYTVNWLRMIADVAYRPVPLEPLLDPETGLPLDLSHAVLRSVSPIHIEYLRNMGVKASMSVSLVTDGKLAGLIACHHYSGPKVVDPVARATSEFLGQSLSWQLRVLEGAQVADRARQVKHHEAELVRSIVSAAELLDGLEHPSLLALTDACGAAAVLDEGTRLVGETPGHKKVAEIVAWLRAQPDDVVATDQLDLQMSGDELEAAAGLLAVPISRDLGEYLLWFRPSTERTVDWAGDPRKVMTVVAPGEEPRLSPRGSFALWREIVRGKSLPWEPWQTEAASNFRRVLLSGFRKRSVELRTLNERLIEADRAKDNFIATVSHELRTPLNTITGWTQLLQSGALPADRIAHGLAVIARNAQAQVQIVDDLLDVSRMASGKVTLDIESVDLPSLVHAVLEGSTLALEAKDLRLKRIIDPDAAPVLGDPARLRQIVNNLFTNAMKFTPKGGTITVVLCRRESDVELVVKDTGKGIAPEFLPHIFEAFRQQDDGMNRRSHGLGLGLAIVRKLVELHGGRVTGHSDGEGKGAVFEVRIPIAPVQRKLDTHPAPPPLERAPELAGIRTLLVEDEDDAREMLLQLLGECGAAVLPARSAAEALEIMRSQQVDIIVSDIGMADVDGLQLIREIRKLPGAARALPAIALTAYTRAVDRTRALQAGFQAHVPKPVDAGELVTVIASLVGRLGNGR